MCTNTVVPNSLNFRIFQDMLGNQKLLRLNTTNTTKLAQDLTTSADVIYFEDVGKLSEPNLGSNIFGQVMIGAERITYRTRDTSNNTVSGLRRGVAGTSAMSHSIGVAASDIGPGEQLPTVYQEKTTTDATNIGDGTTRIFFGTGIVVPTTLDSTELDEAVRVSVGGAVMIADTDYIVTRVDATQVEITFTVAPAVGSEINISIVKAQVMYAQGASTASNGIALQDQTTAAALFLKS